MDLALPKFVDIYANIPECRPYHPMSELSKMSGYYPNINDSQLAAASQVLKIIQDEKLDFNTDREDQFLKILRFLRARKFNVKNTMIMIREDVKWRSEKNRLNLSSESAQEVLNCEVSLLYKYFPVWFQGYDKQMRPVSYRQFGKFEIWNVLSLTTMERLIRFHAWETEQALRSMYSLSDKTGYNIETFLLVIDAAGWNMKLATSDAFTFIKGMAVTDSDHYPERLGNMVIINAPSVLSFAWRIIQGFLDTVTKEKIRILSTDPAEWQPVLQHFIARDQIPIQYGGTAWDLTADEAISMMNPPVDDKSNESGDADQDGVNHTPPRDDRSDCSTPLSDITVSTKFMSPAVATAVHHIVPKARRGTTSNCSSMSGFNNNNNNNNSNNSNYGGNQYSNNTSPHKSESSTGVGAVTSRGAPGKTNIGRKKVTMVHASSQTDEDHFIMSEELKQCTIM